MARWYARFDSGSNGTTWNTELESTDGYFMRLRIGASSASGAQLRDGLILSRSNVSTEVYDDLDGANKSGANGTYFPPDLQLRPDATLVSWSNAYTSSFNGIKTPTSNEYGFGSVNYSTRPTASVISSYNKLVGPATPADPIQLTYASYVSASSAVLTVLNAIQNGAGTPVTPYNRLGTNSQRTLHSIWHNPGLDYFAWDDFTPGTASLTQGIDNVASYNCSRPFVGEITSLGDPVNTNLTLLLDLGPYVYTTDENPNGKVGFQMSVVSSSGATYTLDVGYTDSSIAFLFGTDTGSSNGPVGPRLGVASSWTWTASSKRVAWSIGFPSSSFTQFNSFAKLYDEKIPTNTGANSTKTTLSTCNEGSFIIIEGLGS